MFEQVTLLERALGKNKLIQKMIPREAVLLELEKLFNGMFYIAVLVKTRTS